MEDMNFEQVLKLVNAVSDSTLTELNFERGEVKLCLKKTAEGCVQTVTPVGNAEPAKVSESKQVEKTQENTREGFVVKSPLVGTFYSAPSENSETYVSLGDRVEKGQVLAIVEAMKLMNEIESEFSGEIVEILVQNEETVEYGQPLFVIR